MQASQHRAWAGLILLSWLLVPHAHAQAQANARAEARNPLKVLVVGDQVSRAANVHAHLRWTSGLKTMLGRHDETQPVRMINVSREGATSHRAREQISRLLRQHNPALVVVQVGAMDQFKGYTQQFTGSNLRSILQRIDAHGARAILVGITLPDGVRRPAADGLQTVYERVAKAARVPLALIDLATVFSAFDLTTSDLPYIVRHSQPAVLSSTWTALAPIL